MHGESGVDLRKRRGHPEKLETALENGLRIPDEILEKDHQDAIVRKVVPIRADLAPVAAYVDGIRCPEHVIKRDIVTAQQEVPPVGFDALERMADDVDQLRIR